jgi:hypothetical protein
MAKFTRQHYQAIADVVTVRADCGCADMFTRAERTQLAEKLADMFAHDNPRFDRDRFLTACGVQA